MSSDFYLRELNAISLGCRSFFREFPSVLETWGRDGDQITLRWKLNYMLLPRASTALDGQSWSSISAKVHGEPTEKWFNELGWASCSLFQQKIKMWKEFHEHSCINLPNNARPFVCALERAASSSKSGMFSHSTNWSSLPLVVCKFSQLMSAYKVAKVSSSSFSTPTTFTWNNGTWKKKD